MTVRDPLAGRVVFEDELAERLDVSPRTLRKLRRAGALDRIGLPTLPSLDRKPRWSGDVVQQWIDGRANLMTRKLSRAS